MSSSRSFYRLAFAAVAVVALSACDERVNPLIGTLGGPGTTVTTGTFNVRAVDDSALPHVTTGFGTVYSLVSGNMVIAPDSSWEYHSHVVVTAPDGTFLGVQDGAATGRWIVRTDTIDLQNTAYANVAIKGDTLFWEGPHFAWEGALRYALTK